MRKNKNFALGTAALLLSTAGFTACSSDDAFTGSSLSGEAVKTQFAISIPATGKVNNRMGQDIVQDNGQNFRGMTNIRLVPFSLGGTAADNPLTSETLISSNAIILGNITGTGTGWYEDAKAQLYSDVEIPLNTNAFLFYGEALEGSDETDATNGAIVPSYEEKGWNAGITKLSDISFSLKGIADEENVSIKSAEGDLLLILNGLLAVSTTGGVKWSAGEATVGKDLAGYYDSFKSLKAGSAKSILLAIQDLYNAMKSGKVDDNSTGLTEAIIDKIAGAQNSSFTASEGANEQYTLSYKSTDKNVTTFPATFGLPDGAVQVTADGGSFVYVTDVNYDGNPNNIFNVASLNKYVYPASLYYWVNTNIATSAASESDAYGNSTWNDVLAQYDNSGSASAVTATTQSVALRQPINYAVGRLDVKAKFADGEILDNAKSSPKVVTIPSEGFTLKGILIGGQKAVDWNFETNKDADEYTIYDSKVPENTGISRTSGNTVANRTLVLQTTATAGNKVNFALEFVNNGQEAFTGADGIVPVGGKFYLVGQLTSTTENPNVFKQDLYTTATVTINSLKNAYNCVPDLRSPKLELGLSVDLKWEEGLSQDVTIQ